MTPDRRLFLKQLGFGMGGIALLSSTSPDAWAAEAAGLPRSTPEAEGLSSAAIQAFLDALAPAKIELHSFVLARHGKVIAEGWWKPYAPELRHGLYSLSKSFTSTAIGLLIAEGKLKVDDKIISFFPKDLPDPVPANLAAAEVKHLLSMSVGHVNDPTTEAVKNENWVKAFMAWPIPKAPGTTFVYNSVGTYTLSAIVQQITGKTVLEYLRPRLLEPLGIENATWETCPRGINCGGWGLSLPTEALAKFAQLYLQKGQWNGREIIPAKWVEEATTFKIQQPGGPNDKNDWVQGYCYQFWRCTHNAYRGDGAFGQFLIVMPEQDAVMAITAECQNMQGEINLVWKHLVGEMKNAALPADPAAQASLQKSLAGLALQPPRVKPDSVVMARLGEEVTVELEKNDLGWRSARFETGKASAGTTFVVEHESGKHAVRNGRESWVLGETALPGMPPRLGNGGRPPAGTKFKVAASATWKDENTLEMTWRFYETPHHETLSCKFDGDKVQISFTNPDSPQKRPVLKGTIKAERGV
jgi:CubicO group peptidase (beta-lactamase class C family)